MSNKILVIGQAPSARKQEYPYDSTQFYDWLEELDISKEQAQELFIFDSVYNHFPGFKQGGGHLVPTQEQMDSHWSELSDNILHASKVLVFGNVAKDYLISKGFTDFEFLMHPSKLNFNLYQKNKEKVLSTLKKLL